MSPDEPADGGGLHPFAEGGAAGSEKPVGTGGGAGLDRPAEEKEDELGERALHKPCVQPRTPTAAEIEEHEVTHYPYRSWCRFCRAARPSRSWQARGRR